MQLFAKRGLRAAVITSGGGNECQLNPEVLVQAAGARWQGWFP